MKLLSIIFILLLLSLSSCTRVNYNQEQNRIKQERSDDQNNDLPNFTLDEIQDLDLDELKDKIDLKSENCGDYKSITPSLHIISDPIFRFFGTKNNPIRSLKNCLAKSIDDSLRPVCEAEQRLNELEREHRDDDLALAEIDQARYNVETIKYSVVDSLYEAADDLDRAYGKKLDKLLDKNSGSTGDIIELVLDTEIGSFVQFFENKANSVCLDTIDFRSRRR